MALTRSLTPPRTRHGPADRRRVARAGRPACAFPAQAERARPAAGLHRPAPALPLRQPGVLRLDRQAGRGRGRPRDRRSHRARRLRALPGVHRGGPRRRAHRLRAPARRRRAGRRSGSASTTTRNATRRARCAASWSRTATSTTRSRSSSRPASASTGCGWSPTASARRFSTSTGSSRSASPTSRSRPESAWRPRTCSATWCARCSRRMPTPRCRATSSGRSPARRWLGAPGAPAGGRAALDAGHAVSGPRAVGPDRRRVRGAHRHRGRRPSSARR